MPVSSTNEEASWSSNNVFIGYLALSLAPSRLVRGISPHHEIIEAGGLATPESYGRFHLLVFEVPTNLDCWSSPTNPTGIIEERALGVRLEIVLTGSLPNQARH
jgi:hypothetical protein